MGEPGVVVMFAALLCGAPLRREAHRLLPGNASLILQEQQLPGACPTAADVQGTDAPLRWAVWDAVQDSGGSPCVLDKAKGECGDEIAPCHVRVWTKAAEVAAKRAAAATPAEKAQKREATRAALADVALLVTTFNENREERGGSPEREAMYKARVRWWLEHSSLDMYVVDSAGRCFPDLLPGKSKDKSGRVLECVGFDQEADPSYIARVRDGACVATAGNRCPLSSSFTEALAVNKTFEAFPELATRRLVLKLTGKYVLPGLETALMQIKNGTVAVVQSQHAHFGRWQNTELWGMRGDLVKSCIEGMPTGQLMEQRVYECVTDAAIAAGYGAVDPGPNCPTVAEVMRTPVADRWTVWDSSTPDVDGACAFSQEHGECGVDSPCHPKARAAEKACCTESGCAGVHRFLPLEVPEEFRAQRGDGSTMEALKSREALVGNASDSDVDVQLL